MSTITKVIIVPVNNTKVLNLSDLGSLGSHVFIATKFIDANAVTVTPSSGSFTFEVFPTGMDDPQSIVNGTDIPASAALSLLSYAANTDKVRYTPDTIVGADRIVITIIANEN